MAAKTPPFFLFGAFACLGPVHGVHREELRATPYQVAWQHPQRAFVDIAGTKGNASSQTLRKSSTRLRTIKWSDIGSRSETGHGAGSAHVGGPQHSEPVAGSQDAISTHHNHTIADIHASTHGLNISSPEGSFDANVETKDKIREEIRELNVSGVIRQADELDDSEDRAGVLDQSHKPNLSSLNSEIGRRYAGDAMGVVTHAVKAAAEQDREAAKVMDQANATFRKAEDAQAKADAILKGALDAEAQLIDAKAAALREVTAAQEVMVAAAKANMDAMVDSSSSPLMLQRERQTAEEAVLKAKRGFNAVRGKLSGAERASVAAQQTAAQAAHTTVVAHHEFKVAKDSAATAAANRARVEKQAAQASDGIVRASEAFDRASKAKEEALQSEKAAKQELADAAHAAVTLTQNAPNGTSQRPSPSRPV